MLAKSNTLQTEAGSKTKRWPARLASVMVGAVFLKLEEAYIVYGSIALRSRR